MLLDHLARHPHGLSGLGLGQPLKLVQPERAAHLRRQGGDRLGQLAHALAADDRLVGAGPLDNVLAAQRRAGVASPLIVAALRALRA